MPPRKPTPRKYCRFCTARLRRKRINGRLEDLTVFKNRKFCDRECMSAGQTKSVVSKAAHHYRARKHLDSVCGTCGSTTKLHAHHIDGDFRNDDAGNIATYCASCHLLKHWKEKPNRIKKRSVSIAALADLLDASEQAAIALNGTPVSTALRDSMKRLHGSLEHI